MSLTEMYHVGIVVPDIAAARARLRELLGVSWGPVLDHAKLDIRDANGNDDAVVLKLCYSTSFPYIELIEESPGTVWECNEHSNLHHIGFFSDALAVDSDRFRAAHCPLALSGRAGADAPAGFTYHRELGVFIEFVDAATRPWMEQELLRPTDSP